MPPKSGELKGWKALVFDTFFSQVRGSTKMPSGDGRIVHLSLLESVAALGFTLPGVASGDQNI